MNDLTASIAQEANAQAMKMDEETQAQVSKLRAETDAILAKRREKIYAEAERKKQELQQQADAKRDLEAMQLTLHERHRLIDEAFLAAQKELSAMTQAKRKALLTALWRKATSQLKVSSVQTTKKDAAFFKGKCKTTTIDGLGGFRAFSADGLVSVDFRYETLLDDIKTRKTAEIAKVLFSRGGR